MTGILCRLLRFQSCSTFLLRTITTLKEDSVLNIKKFAQQKFDPKAVGRLSDRKDEPSPSETVIDLSLGDMVVDVKKLKKESVSVSIPQWVQRVFGELFPE